MIAAFFAQLTVLYVPALQWIFQTEPITTTEWMKILAVAITIIAAVEADKWMRRSRGKEQR
jgi:Ca2+-transporting ATPase